MNHTICVPVVKHDSLLSIISNGSALAVLGEVIGKAVCVGMKNVKAQFQAKKKKQTILYNCKPDFN